MCPRPTDRPSNRAACGADRVAVALSPCGWSERFPFAVDKSQAHCDNGKGRELLICLSVAGFAAANVMLLSVSVWSGATDATRDLFQWISAAIALPAIIFSGRPFFRSAVSALRAGGLNMDVPISLAGVLAAAMSLHETATGGEHAYFDAAVTLVFFLLIGRYLDRRARGKARSAAEQMMPTLLAVTASSARAAVSIAPGATLAATMAPSSTAAAMSAASAVSVLPAKYA